MKKLIIAIFSVSILLMGCQKEKLAQLKQRSHPTESLDAGAIHYYQGKQVFLIAEIKSYHSNELAILLTDKIHHQLAYYYFDNELAEETFLKHYPQLSETQMQLQQTKDLRAYAISCGAIEHYKKTGKILATFTNHLKKNTRTWESRFSLHDHLNAGPGQNVLVESWAPLLGTFDNKAESYAGNQNLRSGAVYKDVFWQGASLNIVASSSFIINFPVNFRNNISSAKSY